MKIGGFQPLSLIDYPAKPCSIIFTQGCVFRCSYCHNPDLIPLDAAPLRDSNLVLEFLEKRKKMIDAVCITGGEPTVQGDLIAFMELLKDRGFSVKLDTNGIKPSVLKEAIDKRLADYIAMDLKAPWERYGDVTGIQARQLIDACRESFAVLQYAGIPHEFRTTIAPRVHSEEDFQEMAGYLKPDETYYIQNTHFTKTLDPNISRDIGFDLDELVKNLQQQFPLNHIYQR